MGSRHTYTSRNKLPVNYATFWWHDSRQWEWQGWIHSHSFQNHGLQVPQWRCRRVVDLFVRFKGGADLFLQCVQDVRVLLKIIGDARKSRGCGFTTRNPMEVVSTPILYGLNRARTRSPRSELQFARLTGCLPHGALESLSESLCGPSSD